MFFPPKEPDVGHPTQDETRRCSLDQKLRAAGFKIKSRPRTGEPIWERQGKVYTQRQVMIALRLG